MFEKNNEQLWTNEAFRRMDESADEKFYDFPRFVTHIDDGAIHFVTELYRNYFPQKGGAILDLMSSWVSHLPEEISYSRVAATGMNEAELAANPRLNDFTLQNLNIKQSLPFGDDEFDGAAICVSVQYLTKPTTVFREVGRVLKVDAPLIVTFSNRCFPTKAVYAWQMFDDEGHIALVEKYFAASYAFKDLKFVRHNPRGGDPLYAVIGYAAESKIRS